VISIPGIKGRPATEVPVITLAEVIASRTKEILKRVMDEIENANCRERLGCGLVLTGGGSQLKGIKELAEYVSGMTARIGNPEEKIVINTEKQSDYDHPMYATGLGLMILSIEKDEDLQALKNEQEQPKSSKKKRYKQSAEAQGENKKGEQTENYYRPWEKLKDALALLITDEDDDDF
jgi:cell division protein FtsA